VTSSDGNVDREIMFIVKNAPRMGRLMQKIELPGTDKSPKWIDAKNFTQKHINESRIAFEHNRPFANLTAFDSANLEVIHFFEAQYLTSTLFQKMPLNVLTLTDQKCKPNDTINRLF
jgi:hypothetical protein